MSVTTRSGVGGARAAQDVDKRLKQGGSDGSGGIFKRLLIESLGLSVLILVIRST